VGYKATTELILPLARIVLHLNRVVDYIMIASFFGKKNEAVPKRKLEIFTKFKKEISLTISQNSN